jgi:hypothetical protein
MSLALVDGSHAPTDDEVRALLGRTFPLYQAVLTLAPVRPEWRFYGPKYGWSLKLFEKKRNLCFVGVDRGELSVAFILGEKALARALDADLPEPLADKVRHARKYPEGYGVTLSLSKKADLDSVRRLLEIKRAG